MGSFQSLAKQKSWQIGSEVKIELKQLVEALTTDSRTITNKAWFWPLLGQNFDAHQFIEPLFSSGKLLGFSYEKSAKIADSLKAFGIGVDNSLEALQDLAKCYRNSFDRLRLIGLTGSNGKTTVKELLGHCLSKIDSTHLTHSNFNNELGVPLTLLKIQEQHRFAVIEMGARHPGDIEKLSDIACADVNLLLNVGSAHLGEFGSLENLRRTKLEIFTSTPSHTVAVCPAWDTHLMKVAKATHERVISFGRTEADVCILEEQLEPSGHLRLKFNIEGKIYSARMSYFHDSLAINCCATLACAYSLGLDLPRICDALESFAGVSRRYEVHRFEDSILIDDTYNANKESMISGLASIKSGFAEQDKILVLGDMLELGDQTQEAHEEVGRYCANIKPQRLITVGQQSRFIASAAEQAGLENSKIIEFATVDELCAHTEKLELSGKLLYAKASNSIRLHEFMDQLIGTKS